MSRQNEKGDREGDVDELPPVPCDFFVYCGSAKAKLAAKRLQSQIVHDNDNAVQSESVKISDEVDRYLADTDTMCDPEKMAAYPTIWRMFIDLNTGLPASAAVERLFSLGGRVFTPLRTCLSSHHFEMMMFLRLSKRF